MRQRLQYCLVAACLIIVGCDAGPFASAESLRTQAQQNLQQKNFTVAAEKADELTRKVPENYEGFFLLAQARAQLDDKNAALAALEAAIKKGYKDDKAIEENLNLKPIRGMAAYAELMDTAFPKREKKLQANADGNAAAGSVGIVETESKTVIRAGDVVVEMPKN